MRDQDISVSQGIYTQLSSILGVFIITYPYTFSQLGIALTVLSTIFMCIISAFTLYFLAKCSKTTNINNFDDLIRSVCTKWFSLLCSIIFYLGCLLPMIFYFNVSIDFYFSLIQTSDFSCTRLYLSIICCIIVTVLCITFRKVENLGFIVYISLISLFIFLVYEINMFFHNFNNLNFKIPLWNPKGENLDSISFVIFAFLSHTNILNIVNCLPTLRSAKYVIVSSNLISTIIYLLVGSIGFYTYPNSAYTYLDNTSDSKFKTLVQILLATVNILSFPLMMIPIRKNILSILSFVNIKEFRYFDFINIVFNCSLCALIVYLMEDVILLKSMFFIVGAFTMFLLPMHLYYNICGVKTGVDMIVFIVCGFLSVFSLYMGVQGLIRLYTNA